MSSQHAVAYTMEILEKILLHLDQKSLLTSAQRVCRYWHDLISQTPIQKHLFFQPDWDRKEASTSDLLAEMFPLWFDNSPGRQDQPPETTQVNTLDLWENRRLFETLPLASPDRNNAFMYEGATWRKMLIQQPPISELVFFSVCNTRTGDFFATPPLVEELLARNQADGSDADPSKSSKPIRMGKFYDELTIDMYGGSPRYFMIMWNTGELSLPSTITSWTFQEEEKEAMAQSLIFYGMIVVCYKVVGCCGAGRYVGTPGKKFVFDKRLRECVEAEEKEREELAIERRRDIDLMMEQRSASTRKKLSRYIKRRGSQFVGWAKSRGK